MQKQSYRYVKQLSKGQRAHSWFFSLKHAVIKYEAVLHPHIVAAGGVQEH